MSQSRREEPSVPRVGYRDIAERIRDAIEAGTLPPGTELGTSKEIAKEHNVAPGTALQALRQLATDGFVTLQPKKKAIVRERPEARIIVRDRHAYRDEIGYFFDQNAKQWRAVGTPHLGLAVAPQHIADMLGIERGSTVIIRDRAMGPTDTNKPLQMSTSYIPVPLASDIPPLGEANSGPGGIYDRIEEHFRSPLQWRETISSRLPNADEQRRLGVHSSAPLLVVTRESRVRSGAGEVIAEVNETRMAAERFAVSYTVERDESARWPREDRP
ncbi:GntR family transcriptional regulator [Streptomyces sp. NBC_01476]|uniref:GntR family transcriptional regulator n=1 Tax=Streptomyces sp. NBC_01476 TaxID=2903881 RepID=UPI002E337DC5|nr:GntR family transcriptional regulator [Streptomyces sp. NBC_01476]